MELIVTDQRSYRSEEPTYRAEAQEFMSDDFPALMPQEVLDILDAGSVESSSATYKGESLSSRSPCCVGRVLSPGTSASDLDLPGKTADGPSFGGFLRKRFGIHRIRPVPRNEACDMRDTCLRSSGFSTPRATP